MTSNNDNFCVCVFFCIELDLDRDSNLICLMNGVEEIDCASSVSSSIFRILFGLIDATLHPSTESSTPPPNLST